MQDELRKTLYPPDRAALLKRIQAEKDRTIQDFVHRIKLLTQQENALTIPQQQPESPKRLSWPNGARRTRK